MLIHSFGLSPHNEFWLKACRSDLGFKPVDELRGGVDSEAAMKFIKLHRSCLEQTAHGQRFLFDVGLAPDAPESGEQAIGPRTVPKQ